MRNNLAILRIIFVVGCIAMCLQLGAQDMWSVDRCMAYAIEHNRTVRQRNYEVDNYEIDRMNAIGNFLQSGPYPLLEARTGKKQRHAKLPAFAPEILLQLAHGLLYHRRRGLLVTSTEQMLQATLYSAGMLLHNPITQAETVAPGA